MFSVKGRTTQELNCKGCGKPTEVTPDPMLDGMLYLGDRGQKVLQFAQDMNYVGYGPLEGDVYTPAFVTAVRKLQTVQKLKVDGKAGPQTLAALADLVSGKVKIEAAEETQAEARSSNVAKRDVPVIAVGEETAPIQPDPPYNGPTGEYDVPQPEPSSKKGTIAVLVAAVVAAVVGFVEPIRDWVIGLFQ